MNYDMEKIARRFENFVNTFSTNYSELFMIIIGLNFRMQQNFTQLMLMHLDKIASAEYFDARNQGAVEAAKYMRQLYEQDNDHGSMLSILDIGAMKFGFEPDTLVLLETERFSGVDLGFLSTEFDGEQFCKHSNNFHRTLQQSFTRLAFSWLEFIRENRRADKVSSALARELVGGFAKGKIKLYGFDKDTEEQHYPSKYLGFI